MKAGLCLAIADREPSEAIRFTLRVKKKDFNQHVLGRMEKREGRERGMEERKERREGGKEERKAGGKEGRNGRTEERKKEVREKEVRNIRMDGRGEAVRGR